MLCAQLPEPKTMTIQLIGKDDVGYDDPEAMTGRWQAYIESFVSVCLHMYLTKRTILIM